MGNFVDAIVFLAFAAAVLGGWQTVATPSRRTRLPLRVLAAVANVYVVAFCLWQAGYIMTYSNAAPFTLKWIYDLALSGVFWIGMVGYVKDARWNFRAVCRLYRRSRREASHG